MRVRVSLAALSFCVLCLTFHMTSAKEKNQLERNVTDLFEVSQWYPIAVALFDQDQDGDLDCLYAVRSELDFDARTVTYTFIFGGRNGQDRQYVKFYVRDGPTKGTMLFSEEDGEGGEQIGTVVYAEHETCSVVQMPYKNRQECILWTVPERVNSLPQTCIDQFEDICDLSVPVYDESCDYKEL
ncbi:uncharacterized protein LOC144167407 [Haemaphysalis longicornis]